MAKSAKFIVKRGEDGLWYFNLTAPNGEIIIQSEGYQKKGAALDTIAALRIYAEIAVVKTIKTK